MSGRVWYRGYGHNVGFTNSDSVIAPIAIPAGRTLLRVRWSWTFVSHQDVPFSELPAAQIVAGLVLLEGSPLPAPPDPIANPTADWLWHEGLGCRAVQHSIISPTYVTQHAPVSEEQRDSHSQRVVSIDNPALCWVFNQEVRGAFTPTWNMQITFSALFGGP